MSAKPIFISILFFIFLSCPNGFRQDKNPLPTHRKTSASHVEVVKLDKVKSPDSSLKEEIYKISVTSLLLNISEFNLLKKPWRISLSKRTT